MDNKKVIVLTGGGSGGHVSLNLALIPVLRNDGWDIHYIGSKNGIEKELVSNINGVTYHSIPVGKLRRYISVENLTDMFRVVKGISEAKKLMKSIKPNIVFSKGGYVSLPVILAAKSRKIPSLIHESDATLGLANRISSKYAEKVFVTFEETLKSLQSSKGVYIGPVVRGDLISENDFDVRKKYHLDDKPIIFVVGGSLGAERLNNILRQSLDVILKKYNVIHGCGKGKIDSSIKSEGYVQLDYIKEDYKDILKSSDLIISRSGSNAIFEFLFFKKPMILVPLAKNTRGDQVLNADRFKKMGFASVMFEENITPESLISEIDAINQNKDKIIEKQSLFEFKNGIDIIYKYICKLKK